jgi:hypothetical protein
VIPRGLQKRLEIILRASLSEQRIAKLEIPQNPSRIGKLFRHLARVASTLFFLNFRASEIMVLVGFPYENYGFGPIAGPETGAGL